MIPHISDVTWYLSFCAWLIWLNIISLRIVHVVTNGRASFLRLNNNPLYVWTPFSLCVCPLMNIQVVSVSWAIMNNALMNMEVHISPWEVHISLFQFWGDIYPEVELLDHMVVLILIFWGTFCFFRVTVPIYIPTNSTKVPFPLHLCQHLAFFNSSHPYRCEVISHSSFDLHCSDD